MTASAWWLAQIWRVYARAMSDTVRRLRSAAVERAVGGPGKASRDARRAAFANANVPAAIAALVAFTFNVIDRLADTFEFHVGSDAMFEAGARHLLTRGYR